MSCYDTIIGLSNRECPCIVEGPDGYNTSDSGIFVDDYDLLKMLAGFEGCESGSAWDVLDKARAAAVRMFKRDVNASLLSRFSQRVATFSGAIGEGVGRGTINSQYQYIGLRIAPNPVRGGVMRITKIGIVFPAGTASGEIAVSLYNSLNALMATRTITKGPGHTVTTLETPIEVPTFTEYSPLHDYYLVYEHNQSEPATYNKTTCGCGGVKSVFNLDNPTWLSGKLSRTTAWQNWLMVAGWSGNTLTDFDRDSLPFAENNNGLTVNVEMGCDLNGIICPGALDYTNNPLAMAQALAVYHQSVVNAIDAVLRSDKLIRAGMINRDTLKADKADFRTKYEAAIDYIAEKATLNNNDCLMCKDPHELRIKLAKV